MKEVKEFGHLSEGSGNLPSPWFRGLLRYVTCSCETSNLARTLMELVTAQSIESKEKCNLETNN